MPPKLATVTNKGRPSHPGSGFCRTLTRNMQGLRDVKSAGNSPANKEAVSRNSIINAVDRNKLKLKLKQSLSTICNPANSPATSDTVLSDNSLSIPDGILNVNAQLPDEAAKVNSTKENKKVCPCGQSSDGKCWNLPCSSCKQLWYNACAGLKADFAMAVLDPE